jgi:1-acyl-sn-glycerol-3-phosphate acyltransferase
MQPPIHYEGLENIAVKRPFVVMANHYARPGFSTPWVALGISAVLPPEITWIMSNEWLFEGNRVAFLLRPLMRFVLRSITLAYGLVPMPTMVQGYSTPQGRTAGVREAIERVRRDPNCILGITPEGMDSPNDKLMLPPSGVGRFLLHLSEMGLPMLPAAVFESDGCLHVHFGKANLLEVADGLSPSSADLAARELLIRKIGELMPE